MLQCADSATTALSKALLPRRAPARRTGSSRSIVHCRWPQVGAPTSTTTDRVTARRRRRRPDSLPAQGFYARRPASQRVRVLPQPSPTERTRPTGWRTPFGCPGQIAPSTRPTRVCRQAHEPVSICQPHCRPPTPRHETPRHPRVPPTLDAPRYRGPLPANRSPFAPPGEPPRLHFRRRYPDFPDRSDQMSNLRNRFWLPLIDVWTAKRAAPWRPFLGSTG